MMETLEKPLHHLNAPVVEAETWNLAAFYVAISGGIEPVTGDVWHYFGIHRTISDDVRHKAGEYTLSHLNTGKIICVLDDETRLRNIAITLKPVLDWSFTDIDHLKSMPEVKAISQILADHGGKRTSGDPY